RLKAESANQEKDEQLRNALVEQAHARRSSGQPGQRFDSLEALDRARALRPDPRLRDEYIACFALADLRPVRQWEGVPHDTRWVVFADGLERYARADAEGNISIRRFADDREVAHLARQGSRVSCHLGAEGRLLVVLRPATAQATGVLQIWKL